MSVSRVAALAAWTIVMSGTATAQSFADVARRDIERREQVHAGKTYTNADLARDSRREPGVAAAPPPAVAGPATATPAPAPPAANSESESATASGNMPADEYWRTQSQGLRARVDEARARVTALAARLDQIDGQPSSPGLAGERALTQQSLDAARRDLKLLTDASRHLEQMSKTRVRR